MTVAIWGKSASLIDVASARKQFEGLRAGSAIIDKANKSASNAAIAEFYEGERNCIRLQNAFSAVGELAKGSRPYAFTYNYSSYGGKRPQLEGEGRIGGNDFSKRDMGQGSVDDDTGQWVWSRLPGWVK